MHKRATSGADSFGICEALVDTLWAFLFRLNAKINELEFLFKRYMICLQVRQIEIMSNNKYNYNELCTENE